MRARITFLTRLILLKLAALFTFVILALYTPSTANLLLDGAGGASKVVAKGTEYSLEAIGEVLGDTNALMPRKGAFELLLRTFGLDMVLLFIGITIALYVAWLMLLAGGRGAVRKISGSGNPRAQAHARLQAGPPR